MKNRIRFTSARQVADAFPAAAGDMGDVPEDVTPVDYMTTLGEGESPTAGVIFAALALPKREAVWWACLCIRGIGRVDDKVEEGLKLAEAWVRHPEEAERRAAGAFAEAEFFEGAGAWIAFAAFTTGGSLAPAGLQAVPPSPEISGKCAAMAVMTASSDEEDFAFQIGSLKAAIASAREFALGGDGTEVWKTRAGQVAGSGTN